MNTYKVVESGFFILETGYDKAKAYRPCWAGWTEAFETRKAARKAMAQHVNELNEAKRGRIGYACTTDNSGHHDGTNFIVCNASEAQSIIESKFHRSYKAALPWWVSLEESED